VHIGYSAGFNIRTGGDEVLAMKSRYKVENVLLFSFDQNILETNMKVLELSKQHKGIYPLYWVQKSRLEEDYSLLERELKNGLCGVKFHGVFEKAPVSDPAYAPVLELLNKNESILLVHCGRYKEGMRESNTSYYHALDMAQKYPKLKVILAHMGGADSTVIRRCLRDSQAFRNIYYDTSGITTPLILEHALKIVDKEKILFGSDSPWCSFRSRYYNIEDADITKEIKQLILHDNFVNLIK
jgi:predicted TIM-barrel fold metal-dependent hydrolase